MWWLLKEPFCFVNKFSINLLAACVFGDSFGSFTDSVFGEFTRQEKTNSSLDLARSDCRPLVVVSKTGSFAGDSLEDIVHERVHDAHSFARDSSVGVNLLQHFVDIDTIAFSTLLWFLLVTTSASSLVAFLSTFGSNTRFGRHLYLEYVRCEKNFANKTDRTRLTRMTNFCQLIFIYTSRDIIYIGSKIRIADLLIWWPDS